MQHLYWPSLSSREFRPHRSILGTIAYGPPVLYGLNAYDGVVYYSVYKFPASRMGAPISIAPGKLFVRIICNDTLMISFIPQYKGIFLINTSKKCQNFYISQEIQKLVHFFLILALIYRTIQKYQ